MQGNELRAALSNNIKRFRSRRDWSQATLAANAGISIPFLSDIERGNKWPYPETLTSLAAALGVEVHELFREEKSLSADMVNSITHCLEDASIAVHLSIEKALQQSFATVKQHYVGE